MDLRSKKIGQVIIQIQHLLKLNYLFEMEILTVLMNSNTTLVKVKSHQMDVLIGQDAYSNTTLVKVKLQKLRKKMILALWHSNTTLVKVKF